MHDLGVELERSWQVNREQNLAGPCSQFGKYWHPLLEHGSVRSNYPLFLDKGI